MIEILDVKKGGEYYNISFKDENDVLYGLILVLAEKCPVTVEFVRFSSDDSSRLVYINKTSAPEEYLEMEGRFLNPILEYIKDLK